MEEKDTKMSTTVVGEAIQCKAVEVQVGDKGLERAVKHLKRKMASEGILRELKRRRHYMKPSVKRRKKAAEAARRRRKRIKQGMYER
ncbi:MAG: 30S ribosomal protein S21 [Myxococcota bacterium]